MDKLIFLLLFNGLYGYVLRDIPTSDLKEYPVNVLVFIPQANDNEDETTTQANITPIEQWSIIWYVASFGGLIAFFLIVSCSEWCCRRRNRSSRNESPSPSAPVTPPPSYDQFAPPTYDSLNCDRSVEKSEFDVYVVPVHALGSILPPSRADDDPPSYIVANDRQLPSPSLSLPNQVNQSA